MRILKTMLSSIALSSIMLIPAAMASNHMEEVPDLSCEDIEFSPAMLEEYPEIDKACLDVVEENGIKYAEVKLELTRVRGRNVNFKFIHEDGSKSERHSIKVDSNFRAKIEGRSYRMNELTEGQVLDIYLPHDRWAIHQPDGDFYDIEVLAMPTTASELPLIAMLGGLFISFAGFLAYRRRRQ